LEPASISEADPRTRAGGNGKYLQPPAAPVDAREPVRISFSAGLVDWMLEQQLSIACTSYRSGKLILFGVDPGKRLSMTEQDYARAMGLHFDGETLSVASLFQIWRLRNMLEPEEFANGANDAVFVPRTAHTTGYVDVHEIGLDGDGTPLFVSSLYSCIGAVDDRFSFDVRWMPSFISAAAPDDRCHLNGMAIKLGQVAFATALGSADGPRSWRDQQPRGGVLIDVAANRIAAGGLAIPHSPRLDGDRLLMLESGEGRLLHMEPGGSFQEIFRFPAFLRGMSLHGDYAIIGASAIRETAVGSPVSARLKADGLAPWSGLLIVHLPSGEVRHCIRFESGADEVFDVAALPGFRNPTTIGPATEELLHVVRARP